MAESMPTNGQVKDVSHPS